MSRLRRSRRKKLQRNYVYRYGQTIGRLQRELFHLLALLQVISLTLNIDVIFCFLLRGKWHEVPIGDKKHVILSASEISHRKSTEHIVFTYSVGFFTVVQNDVK